MLPSVVTIMTLGQAERDRLSTAESILVLASPDDEAIPAIRRQLLADATNPHLLAIVLARPPGDWVDDWERRVGDLPEETVIVAPAGRDEDADVDGAAVERIASPTDFTGLGVRLSERLSRSNGADRDVRLCLDSLTEQCRHADLRSVYRFLHVLVGHLRAANARAQFYLDPTTVDERTVAILTSLFDGVAEREGGDWSVRVRPEESPL